MSAIKVDGLAGAFDDLVPNSISQGLCSRPLSPAITLVLTFSISIIEAVFFTSFSDL